MNGPFSIKSILQRKRNEAIMNPGNFTTPVILESGIGIRIRKDSPIKYTVYLSKDGHEPPSKTAIQTLLYFWPIEAEAEQTTTAIVLTIIER